MTEVTARDGVLDFATAQLIEHDPFKPKLYVLRYPESMKPEYLQRGHAAWEHAWLQACVLCPPKILFIPDTMTIADLTDDQLQHLGLMRIPAKPKPEPAPAPKPESGPTPWQQGGSLPKPPGFP